MRWAALAMVLLIVPSASLAAMQYASVETINVPLPHPNQVAITSKGLAVAGTNQITVYYGFTDTVFQTIPVAPDYRIVRAENDEPPPFTGFIIERDTGPNRIQMFMEWGDGGFQEVVVDSEPTEAGEIRVAAGAYYVVAVVHGLDNVARVYLWELEPTDPAATYVGKIAELPGAKIGRHGISIMDDKIALADSANRQVHIYGPGAISGTFIPLALISGESGPADGFGSSILFLGPTLYVGAPFAQSATTPGLQVGAVYQFQRGASWAAWDLTYVLRDDVRTTPSDFGQEIVRGSPFGPGSPSFSATAPNAVDENGNATGLIRYWRLISAPETLHPCQSVDGLKFGQKAFMHNQGGNGWPWESLGPGYGTAGFTVFAFTKPEIGNWELMGPQLDGCPVNETEEELPEEGPENGTGQRENNTWLCYDGTAPPCQPPPSNGVSFNDGANANDIRGADPCAGEGECGVVEYGDNWGTVTYMENGGTCDATRAKDPYYQCIDNTQELRLGDQATAIDLNYYLSRDNGQPNAYDANYRPERREASAPASVDTVATPQAAAEPEFGALLLILIVGAIAAISGIIIFALTTKTRFEM